VDAPYLLARFLGHAPDPGVELALGAAVLAIAGFALRRLTRAGEDGPRRTLSVGITCLAVLLSMYHQAYDALLLALPMVGLVAVAGREPWAMHPAVRWLLLGFLAVPAVNYLATSTAIARLSVSGTTWLAVTGINSAALSARLPGLRRPRAQAHGMNDARHAAPRFDAWILGAVVVGVALRLARLDSACLWLDEVFTADVVGRSWHGMLAEVLADNHPPLYFVGLKLWADVAGSSPWMLRFPSVLLSALAIALTARLGAVLAGPRVARVAAWLAAVSPMLLHHAQEARMYALVAALAAFHLILLAEFVLGRRPTLGAGFVATALGLALTHYYTVFLLGSSILVLTVCRRRPLGSWMPAAVGVAVAVALSMLPALLLARHAGGGEYGLGILAVPGTAWSMIAEYNAPPDVRGAARARAPGGGALHGRGGAGGVRGGSRASPRAPCAPPRRAAPRGRASGGRRARPVRRAAPARRRHQSTLRHARASGASRPARGRCTGAGSDGEPGRHRRRARRHHGAGLGAPSA
jgi:hypothetical protein